MMVRSARSIFVTAQDPVSIQRPRHIRFAELDLARPVRLYRRLPVEVPSRVRLSRARRVMAGAVGMPVLSRALLRSMM